MNDAQAEAVAGQLRKIEREITDLSLLIRVDNPLSFEAYLRRVLTAVRTVPASARACVMLGTVALTVSWFLHGPEARKIALSLAGNLYGAAFYFAGSE